MSGQAEHTRSAVARIDPPARWTLTVAISNYNHARDLPRAIDAVISQSRPPDEFILVDDKSTDQSAEIIRDYANRIPFIRPIFRERNGGFIAGITDALSASTGDYFYAGSADDCILPGFFEQAMQAAEEFTHAGLVCGDWEMRRGDGTVAVCHAIKHRTRRFLSPADCVSEFMLQIPPKLPPNPATIYRRACLMEAGAYRAELSSSADTFLTLCISARHGAVYVPGTFTAFYDHATGYGGNERINLRRFVEIINESVRIMQTEFSDVFTPAAIRDWRRRSFTHLVRPYVDLTTPYQDVLRFEQLVCSQLSPPAAMLVRGLRKALSFGVLSYQSLIHRTLINRLIRANGAEQMELISLIADAQKKKSS